MKKLSNKIALVLALAVTIIPMVVVLATDPTPTAQIPTWYPTEVLALVTTITNWIFTFLIAVVVIMVLVAGYMFVTGGANPEQVGKARNILMYALIGFAVAMLARGIIAIVAAVIGKGTPSWGY